MTQLSITPRPPTLHSTDDPIAESGSVVDRWLALEMNRVWLLAEACFRALQVGKLRPPSGHPAVAKTEAISDAGPPRPVLE